MNSRRTLALRLVALLVLVLLVVGPRSSQAEGRILYLDVYSYANNLTYYKTYPPDNAWAGYRIRYEQDNSRQITTNPKYNDYRFATDDARCGWAVPA